MSQCYRVELKASVSYLARASDHVRRSIDLASILPREEMVEILRQVLLRRGFTEAEEGRRLSKRGEAGEDVSFDLDALEATSELCEEKELSAEIAASGSGTSNGRARESAKRRLKENEAGALRELSGAERELERELTRRLEASEAERERALNEILQEVYAESLKRKAGRMGDVLSVNESTSREGEYELVIKVAL